MNSLHWLLIACVTATKVQQKNILLGDPKTGSTKCVPFEYCPWLVQAIAIRFVISYLIPKQLSVTGRGPSMAAFLTVLYRIDPHFEHYYHKEDRKPNHCSTQKWVWPSSFCGGTNVQALRVSLFGHQSDAKRSTHQANEGRRIPSEALVGQDQRAVDKGLGVHLSELPNSEAAYFVNKAPQRIQTRTLPK